MHNFESKPYFMSSLQVINEVHSRENSSLKKCLMESEYNYGSEENDTPLVIDKSNPDFMNISKMFHGTMSKNISSIVILNPKSLSKTTSFHA